MPPQTSSNGAPSPSQQDDALAFFGSHNIADWFTAAALGAMLGLGLITKAFFLPIGAGIGALLLARAILSRKPAHLGQAIAAGMVAAGIGGWWYVQKRLETGSFTGSDEFIHLNKGGALGQLADGYSLPELAHGLGQIIATFVWAGTWSLARLPEIWLLPLLALLALLGFDYLRSLRSAIERLGLIAIAPIVLAAPMGAGLVYHVFVWMAGASAATPGWYFHILAAPLGLAVAIGWRRPLTLAALCALTGAYTVIAWSFQLSLFSGCAAKLGNDKHYNLHHAGCFIDPRALVALSHPGVGLISLGLGLTLVACAAVMAACAFKPVTPVCVEMAAL